jgi:hypothetical protein
MVAPQEKSYITKNSKLSMEFRFQWNILGLTAASNNLNPSLTRLSAQLGYTEFCCRENFKSNFILFGSLVQNSLRIKFFSLKMRILLSILRLLGLCRPGRPHQISPPRSLSYAAGNTRCVYPVFIWTQKVATYIKLLIAKFEMISSFNLS